MKKSISIFKIFAITLCFILLIGMYQDASTVNALSSNGETFNLKNIRATNYIGEGLYHKIFVHGFGSQGAYAGKNDALVIYTKEGSGKQISDVKLVIAEKAESYSKIGISSGTLDTDLLESKNVLWLHNVNSPVLEIYGGSDYLVLSEITVLNKDYSGNEYLESDLWVGEDYEVIEFNNDSTANSENFVLESSFHSSDAWSNEISIKSKENSNLRISKLEIEINASPEYINGVIVNHGTIKEDVPSAMILNKFHVEDIHSTEFECSISTILFEIRNIKIYYEENPDYTASIIASGNIWIVVVAVVVIAIGAIFFITKKKKAKQS